MSRAMGKSSLGRRHKELTMALGVCVLEHRTTEQTLNGFGSRFFGQQMNAFGAQNEPRACESFGSFTAPVGFQNKGAGRALARARGRGLLPYSAAVQSRTLFKIVSL